MSLNPQSLVGVGAIITVATPYLAAIFTQDKYPQWVNELIAMLVSLVGGVTTFLASGGQFNSKDLPDLEGTIAAVFALSKVYYMKLLPHSPLITAIEYFTSNKTSDPPLSVTTKAPQ